MYTIMTRSGSGQSLVWPRGQVQAHQNAVDRDTPHCMLKLVTPQGLVVGLGVVRGGGLVTVELKPVCRVDVVSWLYHGGG